MTLISVDNPMLTIIHRGSFNYSLSTANKKYRGRREFVLNNKQSTPKSLSHTAIRQSNAFSIPVIVSIVPDLPLHEYHYNYRYENKDFVVKHLLKQPNELIISAKNRILLQEMLSEIESLLENEYDWDEIDYRKPTPKDIKRSRDVLTEFVSIIDTEGYSLKKPHISNFEEGGASIKWKIGERTLYLEITQNESGFSKVWRESGKRLGIERTLLKKDYLRLWKWVINEE